MPVKPDVAPTHRRAFLRTLGAAGLTAAAGVGACAPAPAAASAPARPGATRARSVRPPRLREGQRVGLVNPSGATPETETVRIVEERLEALGLRPVRGEHVLARHGYLAGTDAQRAADVNRMFADPDIDAIVAVRGGWGAARILPLLDYDAIRAHPKIFLGYSDITALHMALHQRTGLITFHGPVGSSRWNEYSVGYLRQILFEGGAPTLANPEELGDDLAVTADRVRTLTPGTARGTLLGGNLTVLSAIVGSDYLPAFDGAILFLEDVGENIYRVDRMLTQLALAGILGRVAGVVFGKCSDCGPGGGYGSLTMEEVLDHHLGRLGVPAWEGAMIGHIREQWTVPVGVQAEIDAAAGTVRLLEPAVA